MRRFLTLICLLGMAIPAGISVSGCTRNPGANYCNGLGYGLKITDVASITLQPATAGISIAFGQTRQLGTPTASTCHNSTASVSKFNYGTTDSRLVDLSPTGTICAGTWNRNSGGGIPDYTICSPPNPLPSTDGLPYRTAYVSASAESVVSNPVRVYVHAPVTSISLVGPGQCLSQGQQAQLDAEACFSSNNVQYELCAPPTVTSTSTPGYSCKGGAPLGSRIPSCTEAIGSLAYQVGSSAIASLVTNTTTNQVTITAEQPGTTVIDASVAGAGSTAGYFSTCPPKSISLTLANGETVGTITKGVTQNLVTSVTDVNGNTITGLVLDYQSTDPIDISVSGGGAITTLFPGTASVNAVCQPPSCNPAPVDRIGFDGTGVSISSNPVKITTPGTASDLAWFSAPGLSQYFVSANLLTGTVSSAVRLPYVPNSMVMDRTGTNLYFGSATELMIYSTATNALSKQDLNAPGVVLAVSPNNQTALINDQARRVFYLYNVTGGYSSTFAGLGNSASWTPDAKTLYVTDNAALGGSHTDTLYVYSTSSGWTTHPLPPSPLAAASVPSSTAAPNQAGLPPTQTLAVTIPGVGAYLRGSPTVAHTWCPQGTVGDTASMIFYPQGDEVLDASENPVQTDSLAATTDGQHILGAALINGEITLSDIGVTIPTSACPSTTTTSGTPPTTVQTLLPLEIEHTVNQAQFNPAVSLGNVNATTINQVIASPASNLAFVTYSAPEGNTNALLPYYQPAAGNAGMLGTLGYVTLTGASAISAPLAGAFTPDDKLFFVSTAGDNKIHYIDVPTLTDAQQISPSLPACTPVTAGGKDAGCTFGGTESIVPVTVITVKPRSTT